MTLEIRTAMSELFRRWVTFNLVGLMGVAVQILALWVLHGWLGFHYLPATALAVEAAILHNFFWHERWTWSDRGSSVPRAIMRRLVGFNLATGAVSISGNLLWMALFAGVLGVPYLLASLASIALCSLANFLLSDRLVFRAQKPDEPAAGVGLSMRRRRVRTYLQTSAAWALILTGTTAGAAELRPETVRAWDLYVRTTEARIDRELSSHGAFLALDSLPDHAPAQSRKAARSGEIVVTGLRTTGPDGGPIEMPGGMVHHWVGLVFIPGADLEAVLTAVAGGGAKSHRQEDVLESRVLARDGESMRIYLKLVRSRIVTVAYNTEHVVRYRRHGARRAASRSTADRIAELEDFNTPAEREKPVGRDSGFLWRLNSYWRYEQVDGGVLVECESISLSRDVPAAVAFLVRPIIRRIAGESMTRTLASLCTRLVHSSFAANGRAEGRLGGAPVDQRRISH